MLLFLRTGDSHCLQSPNLRAHPNCSPCTCSSLLQVTVTASMMHLFLPTKVTVTASMMHLFLPTTGDSHSLQANRPGVDSAHRGHRHDHSGVRVQPTGLCPPGCDLLRDCTGGCSRCARQLRKDCHPHCQPCRQCHRLHSAGRGRVYLSAHRHYDPGHLPERNRYCPWRRRGSHHSAQVHARPGSSSVVPRCRPDKSPSYWIL